MKKILFLILLSPLFSFSQSKEASEIINILHTQDEAWNHGDIDGFMQTYWNNDSLIFIGKSGPTYGWQQTLDRYKKGYPDSAAMGKLHFDLIEIKKLSSKYYFVVGKWYLQRSIGDINGSFTLLLKKIKGKWLIIADHSS